MVCTCICVHICGACTFNMNSFIHSSFLPRIDHKGVIKVADFGLSMNMYEKMYFRQDKREGVKLPVKWMAIESIEDAVFSEKTDVVSKGAVMVVAMGRSCC